MTDIKIRIEEKFMVTKKWTNKLNVTYLGIFHTHSKFIVTFQFTYLSISKSKALKIPSRTQLNNLLNYTTNEKTFNFRKFQFAYMDSLFLYKPTTTYKS